MTRWNLKRYAKGLLFKVDFAVFWAPKEIVGGTKWVQNTVDDNQRWSRLVSMQKDSCMDILGIL